MKPNSPPFSLHIPFSASSIEIEQSLDALDAFLPEKVSKKQRKMISANDSHAPSTDHPGGGQENVAVRSNNDPTFDRRTHEAVACDKRVATPNQACSPVPEAEADPEETEDEEVKVNCIGGLNGIRDSDLSSEEDDNSDEENASVDGDYDASDIPDEPRYATFS